MGALERVRRLVERLPLGEAPPWRDGIRSPAEAKAVLAATLHEGEEVRWAGWIWVGRGAGPHDGLVESAAAVTDRRVVWAPLTEGLDPDEELLTDIERVLVDRKSLRMLLVTAAHDEDSPDLAVLFHWERDLFDALQAGRAATEEDPDRSGSP